MCSAKSSKTVSILEKLWVGQKILLSVPETQRLSLTWFSVSKVYYQATWTRTISGLPGSTQGSQGHFLLQSHKAREGEHGRNSGTGLPTTWTRRHAVTGTRTRPFQEEVLHLAPQLSPQSLPDQILTLGCREVGEGRLCSTC